MNWTVSRLDGPLEDPARVYTPPWGTPVAQAITRATAQADQEVEADPSQAGGSRSGHRRIVVVRPLAIEFEVFAE